MDVLPRRKFQGTGGSVKRHACNNVQIDAEAQEAIAVQKTVDTPQAITIRQGESLVHIRRPCRGVQEPMFQDHVLQINFRQLIYIKIYRTRSCWFHRTLLKFVHRTCHGFKTALLTSLGTSLPPSTTPKPKIKHNTMTGRLDESKSKRVTMCVR